MHGMVSRAKPARNAGAPVFAILLPVLCIAAFALLIVTRPEVPHGDADAAMLNSVLLWNSIMPRAMLALIAGAALGLSGTLLQRVLRNPIADASTLGIASGAELAMTAAMGFSPLLIGFSREMAAFGGGLVAASGRRFVRAHCRCSRAVRHDCVELQSWNGWHCRRERLIGNAVPVQALLSAARGPSMMIVDVSGTVMTCHRRMAEGCRSAARLRSAAWCPRNRDRLRSRLR